MQGRLQQECHHLGHAAPSEAECKAREEACLAACADKDAG